MTVLVRVLDIRANAAAVTLEIEVDGHKLFVSFHGADVVKNGWQPYDQPNPSAYVPKHASEMHVIDGAGGSLLISGSTHQ